MNLRRKLLLLIVAAAPLAACQSASAQCGYGLMGYGFGIGQMYRIMADNVPHYAAFPPVYYSHPVPRTYGYSPFAYLPTERTPEVIIEAPPLAIANPYLDSQGIEAPAVAQPPQDRTASLRESSPIVIHNPFAAPAIDFDGGPVLQTATREW